MSIQELALLEFYADIFDFDKNHQSFGFFAADFEEIAMLFDCKSTNTVRNWHNKLLKLGFIKKMGLKNVYELTCYLRYINPGHWGGKANEYTNAEKDQSIKIILQSFGIDLHSIGGKLQYNEVNDATSATKSQVIAISSSKDEYRDSFQSKRARSEEEYNSIKTRVEKLGETIGDNWFSSDSPMQDLVQEHQDLANKMLEYEIEHDLLPL